VISTTFRARLALMAVGRYGFGDHVTDPSAYHARMVTLHRQSWTTPLVLKADPETPDLPVFRCIGKMHYQVAR
jgi:hypothetical protein